MNVKNGYILLFTIFCLVRNTLCDEDGETCSPIKYISHCRRSEDLNDLDFRDAAFSMPHLKFEAFKSIIGFNRKAKSNKGTTESEDYTATLLKKKKKKKAEHSTNNIPQTTNSYWSSDSTGEKENEKKSHYREKIVGKTPEYVKRNDSFFSNDETKNEILGQYEMVNTEVSFFPRRLIFSKYRYDSGMDAGGERSGSMNIGDTPGIVDPSGAFSSENYLYAIPSEITEGVQSEVHSSSPKYLCPFKIKQVHMNNIKANNKVMNEPDEILEKYDGIRTRSKIHNYGTRLDNNAYKNRRISISNTYNENPYEDRNGGILDYMKSSTSKNPNLYKSLLKGRNRIESDSSDEVSSEEESSTLNYEVGKNAPDARYFTEKSAVKLNPQGFYSDYFHSPTGSHGMIYNNEDEVIMKELLDRGYKEPSPQAESEITERPQATYSSSVDLRTNTFIERNRKNQDIVDIKNAGEKIAGKEHYITDSSVYKLKVGDHLKFDNPQSEVSLTIMNLPKDETGLLQGKEKYSNGSKKVLNSTYFDYTQNIPLSSHTIDEREYQENISEGTPSVNSYYVKSNNSSEQDLKSYAAKKALFPLFPGRRKNQEGITTYKEMLENETKRSPTSPQVLVEYEGGQESDDAMISAVAAQTATDTWYLKEESLKPRNWKQFIIERQQPGKYQQKPMSDGKSFNEIEHIEESSSKGEAYFNDNKYATQFSPEASNVWSFALPVHANGHESVPIMQPKLFKSLAESRRMEIYEQNTMTIPCYQRNLDKDPNEIKENYFYHSTAGFGMQYNNENNLQLKAQRQRGNKGHSSEVKSEIGLQNLTTLRTKMVGLNSFKIEKETQRQITKEETLKHRTGGLSVGNNLSWNGPIIPWPKGKPVSMSDLSTLSSFELTNDPQISMGIENSQGNNIQDPYDQLGGSTDKFPVHDINDPENGESFSQKTHVNNDVMSHSSEQAYEYDKSMKATEENLNYNLHRDDKADDNFEVIKQLINYHSPDIFSLIKNKPNVSTGEFTSLQLSLVKFVHKTPNSSQLSNDKLVSKESLPLAKLHDHNIPLIQKSNKKSMSSENELRKNVNKSKPYLTQHIPSFETATVVPLNVAFGMTKLMPWREEIQSMIDKNEIEQKVKSKIKKKVDLLEDKLRFIVNHDLHHLDKDRPAVTQYLQKNSESFIEGQNEQGKRIQRKEKREIGKKKNPSENVIPSKDLGFILHQRMPRLPTFSTNKFIQHITRGKNIGGININEDKRKYSKLNLQDLIDKNMSKIKGKKMKYEVCKYRKYNNTLQPD